MYCQNGGGIRRVMRDAAPDWRIFFTCENGHTWRVRYLGAGDWRLWNTTRQSSRGTARVSREDALARMERRVSDFYIETGWTTDR